MDEAVGQALKTWQVPATQDKEQDKIIEAIDDLNAQVKALTKKVTSLEKSLKED